MTNDKAIPKRVWVKVRAGDSYTIKWGKRIISSLIERGVEVFVDPLLGYAVDAKVLPETMLNGIDLAIIVGGDGTLLRTLQKSRGNLPPVLGFSAKSLGFFFEHSVENYETVLDSVLGGQYKLLPVALGGYSFEEYEGVFLNEISAWADTGKVIEYEVSVDGEKIYHARSDGLILNTPAGSTGHALSYGSPIFFGWSDPLISFFPVGPLSPLIRPFIVSRAIIEVSFLTWPSILIVDGQRKYEVRSGSTLAVEPDKSKLYLVYLGDHIVNGEKIRERLFDRGFSRIGK